MPRAPSPDIALRLAIAGAGVAAGWLTLGQARRNDGDSLAGRWWVGDTALLLAAGTLIVAGLWIAPRQVQGLVEDASEQLGLRVGSIVQSASGNQDVQAAGNQDTSVTVSYGTPPPPTQH